MNTHIDVSSWNDKLDNQTRQQKQIYYVRYKWATNDRAWLDLEPVRVRAISEKNAAETLVDCNPGVFLGDVSLMVSVTENSAGNIYHISQLD
jgi:hypothetical protein